jgi:hypothetical protein
VPGHTVICKGGAVMDEEAMEQGIQGLSDSADDFALGLSLEDAWEFYGSLASRFDGMATEMKRVIHEREVGA